MLSDMEYWDFLNVEGYGVLPLLFYLVIKELEFLRFLAMTGWVAFITAFFQIGVSDEDVSLLKVFLFGLSNSYASGRRQSRRRRRRLRVASAPRPPPRQIKLFGLPIAD